MKVSIGAKPLLYSLPVLIVGSYKEDGSPNMMSASWGGICCSQPPCVSISLRKATQTYHNIQKHQAFTINIPSEDFVKEADYAGVASGKDVDKFEKTNLTATKSGLVDAPIIEEFPMNLECKLFQVNELGLHTQFIGEILDIKINEEFANQDGTLPDILKIKPFVYGGAGNREYFGIGKSIGEARKIGQVF